MTDEERAKLREASELLSLATSEREKRSMWLIRVIKARSIVDQLAKELDVPLSRD